MKVLRLTPHFYYTPDVVDEWIVRLDQMGGMQTQIYRQAIALSQKGVKQLVLPITMPKAPKIWKINPRLIIKKGNIPMLPIKSAIRGTVGLNFYWGVGVCNHILKYKMRNTKFDIIHVHCSGVAAPLIVGYIAKVLLKKPLVYTVHCCRISTYHPMSRFDTKINKWVVAAEKFCLEHADYTITLTQRTKDIIQDNYNIADDKIMIIPDVIDPEEFTKNLTQENIEIFRRQHNLNNGKRNIVFVGRIAYEKGCKVLLEAFHKLNRNDCNLLFYGDGNEREMLEVEIKKMRLEDRCHITGYLPNTDISLAIETADLMVMPSLHEEFGGLILEIAAVGKAVIGSNIGGIPTLIENDKSGLLFECGNADELCQKINSIIDNEELLTRYGVQLKENILKTYSFDYNIDQMVKLYRDMEVKKC